MKQLFDELVTRPLSTFISVMEMFSERVQSAQGIDGMLSRFAHTLSSPPLSGSDGGKEILANLSRTDPISNDSANSNFTDQLTSDFSDEDRRILERVEGACADGRTLKLWWDRTYPDGFAEKFELQRVFNRPDHSFGFFDQVQLKRGMLPVMGNFQNMFYDQPRTPVNVRREAAAWMRDQLREFVLRYFMRVSSFRQPEVYVESERPDLPGYLERLSWCTEPSTLRQGFGFTQHYYKLRDTGRIGKFPPSSD